MTSYETTAKRQEPVRHGDLEATCASLFLFAAAIFAEIRPCWSVPVRVCPFPGLVRCIGKGKRQMETGVMKMLPV